VKDAQDLRFLRLNRPAQEALGLGGGTAREFKGTTDYDYLPADQADRVRARDVRFLASGQPIEVAEEPVASSEGVRHFLTKRMPILGPTGQPLYLLGISEDVTERKRVEAVLERQREELTRSNVELEQFASIASHDLQEPLRKIRSFGDRLQAAMGDQLPESARGYLDRMLAAAARMQALIEDLLAYSHVSSRARPFPRVDLDRVVGGVVSDLEASLEEAQGRIECGSLPAVQADETQMRQLFQNLITNALKFRRPGVPPVVTVAGRPADGLAGGEVEVEVRDNGIGIEEPFLEQIFAPFERLNPRSEYKGTGIGLAICRKIAERHRGTITVESRVGEGSVFRVRLPAAVPAPSEVSI
jgi:light-regulated signal transduction histidine kinase (bacteriophytochrome)